MTRLRATIREKNKHKPVTAPPPGVWIVVGAQQVHWNPWTARCRLLQCFPPMAWKHLDKADLRKHHWLQSAVTPTGCFVKCSDYPSRSRVKKKKSFPACSLDHWLAVLGACIHLDKKNNREDEKNANKFIKNKIQFDFNYYDYQIPPNYSWFIINKCNW